MRPHRRALFSGDVGCWEDGHWSACPPPPPPLVPSTPDSGPGPSPSPWLPPPWPPCLPPVFPPAPSPAHNGRRDQGGGMHGYGPPPPGGSGDHDRRHFIKYALIAAGVIAFVSLILLGVSVAVRRRQVRRRRQALLAAPSLNAGGAANLDDDAEWGGGGGGGVVHHVWNIRTVGLDEASIGSIAVTRYRAGAGLLGAADCSVCLGEFQDGELVRLLPKCAHAFHVPCIDTWLRAHVNCPICRSDVLDPAVTAAAAADSGSESVGSNSSPPPDPDANANAEADHLVSASSDAAPDHEQEAESDGRDASPADEDQQEQQSSSADPPPPPPQELLCPLPRNVRRAASMDAAAVSTAADVAELDRLPEEAPEEEQIGGRRKRCTVPSRAKASGSGHRSNLSTDRLVTPTPSSGVPRSFFSRHCRARSSVLPL